LAGRCCRVCSYSGCRADKQKVTGTSFEGKQTSILVVYSHMECLARGFLHYDRKFIRSHCPEPRLLNAEITSHSACIISHHLPSSPIISHHLPSSPIISHHLHSFTPTITIPRPSHTTPPTPYHQALPLVISPPEADTAYKPPALFCPSVAAVRVFPVKPTVAAADTGV
jgi:hypothetical protein